MKPFYGLLCMAALLTIATPVGAQMFSGGPEGFSPGGQAMLPLQSFDSSGPSASVLANTPHWGSGGGNVEVIVNPTLFAGGQITTSLQRYLADLQFQGYTPTLTTTAFASPGALRSHLGNRHGTSGLAGAVLIGDLPIPYFERNGQFGNPNAYQRFPCDLYYMDLDGSWSDTTSSGTFDAHTGDVVPEIWVGRMVVSPLTGLHSGRTEPDMINSYFDRNHAYRWGNLSLPVNGLAYIDDDWIPWANSWGNALGSSLTGNVTIVSDGATTVAADYRARLDANTSPGFESILLAAHSSAGSHSFKIGDAWTGGSVASSQLAALDPQVFFYNLFCCSNANYSVNNYMGGEYVFGTDLGLLAVGSTKTGSMLAFDDYYYPLGGGATFGEAYLAWWTARAVGGFSDYEKDWHYGMTLLGDPLLYTQAFVIPEPGSAVLLGFVVLMLLAFGRRRRSARV